jgi:hypothetical protein
LFVAQFPALSGGWVVVPERGFPEHDDQQEHACSVWCVVAGHASIESRLPTAIARGVMAAAKALEDGREGFRVCVRTCRSRSGRPGEPAELVEGDG